MIVIIGSGYAGAATAMSLARRGAEVTVLEAEDVPAQHASGRNAGLIGALLGDDPPMIDLQLRGARMISSSFGMIECGSVLLTQNEQEAESIRVRAADRDVRVEVLSTSDLSREIPFLEGARSGYAVRCPSEGMVDPAGLAARYLAEAREAGARVVTGARVTALELKGSSVTGVMTTTGRVEAETVVNAAGAWAGALAESIGEGALTDMNLRPYRRHLLTTPGMPPTNTTIPWVWDLTHGLYVRTDPSQMTLCACDEDPHAVSVPSVSRKAYDDLAEKTTRALPALASARIGSAHACLRTFTGDRRYVIGPDPGLEGFFWVAGLGGSGATASAAIGELAAELILDLPPVNPSHQEAFSPERLAS